MPTLVSVLTSRHVTSIVIAATVLVLSRSPIRAHHAIGEIYDEARTIAVEGVIESFWFDNPHSRLHVKVNGDNGTPRTWAVEWRAAARLARLGLTAHALNPGDRIMVCGNPGRDPASYRLYLLHFERLPRGRPPRVGAMAAECPQ